jgi:hypothetical protein
MIRRLIRTSVLACLLVTPGHAAPPARDAALADAQKRMRAAIERSSTPEARFITRADADACRTTYAAVFGSATPEQAFKSHGFSIPWASAASLEFKPGAADASAFWRNYINVNATHPGYWPLHPSPEQVGPMLQAGNELIALCKGAPATPSPLHASGLESGAKPGAATTTAFTCPKDRAALARFLKGRRVLTSKAETPGAIAGNFVLFGDSGENTYDTAGITAFGVRPTRMEAGIIGGRPSDLELMLPGHDIGPYAPAFRAAYRGETSCSTQTCTWHPRKDSWNEPADNLETVWLALTVLSDTETSYRCSYR